MSAMLESYDMPMLDYQSDLDIQMHPSSSDPWFQDEAKMEEDGPLKVPENYSHTKQMKADNYSQEKSIEVDMESSVEHQNVEYDMLDDDEIQQSRAELLDVEVYDVSLAHSPAMVTFDIGHEQHSNTPHAFELANPEHLSLPTSSGSPLQLSETPVLDSDASDSTPLPLEDKASAYEPPFEAIEEAVATPELLDTIHTRESEVDHLDHHEILPQQYRAGVETTNLPSEDQPSELVEHLHVLEPVEGHDQVDSRDDTATDYYEPDQVQENQTAVQANSVSADASGDPHEISEGVYIDPPPPVLLSVSSEDQYNYSFFNESPDWSTPSGTESESHPADRVLLHHLPTMYYEPLSTVFGALRREGSLQSIFQMAESELVLEAVDLQLTIGEDNIYARDVTLHDLNILHDVSGIVGLLRMRLYALTPRFITRYQYLQEQVSRSNLDLSSGEVPAEAITELEAPHEEHVEPQEAETTYEAEPVDDAPDSSAKTASASYLQATGNEDSVHNEVLSEALATGSYEEASDLPPLPADTLEEEDINNQEENEEDGSILQLDLSPDDHVRPSDRASTPEVEAQAVDSLSNNYAEGGDEETIALEVLEASNEDESYTEEQQFDGSHDYQEEEPAPEEVTGGYDEEESHDAEEVDEKFDPSDSAGDGPEVLDPTLLVEGEDITPVELGLDVDAHIHHLQEDQHSNQNIDELAEGRVTSENSSSIENEEDLGHDALKILESAADPITLEGDWEDDLDGEGELDTTWDDENENALSNHSSVTLSSKASKRSFDEFESGDVYDHDDGGDARWTPPSSPDPKRSRTQ